MSMMPKGTLFVLSGPSGVGKSTLCGRLRREFPEIGLSVSYTTRAPRDGEQDGVHYHFVDRARFDAMIDEGAFVEWAEVHGNRYGTAFSEVGRRLGAGLSVLFDIDYQGAASLRAVYPETVTVMVLPPSLDELERRLRGRASDEEAVILHRLKNAIEEIRQTQAFEFMIVNDDLEHSYETLRSIYVAAQHRVSLRGEELLARFGFGEDTPAS